MLMEEVRILVVEDVNAMRVQIRDLLKTFGFRSVSICGDAVHARMLLETEVFHLILCDWHLGEESGIDLLRYIRQEPKLKNIGFIMVTGERTKEMVLEAIQAGVDDYLLKPLTVLQIQEKVYNVLLRKKVLEQ